MRDTAFYLQANEWLNTELDRQKQMLEEAGKESLPDRIKREEDRKDALQKKLAAAEADSTGAAEAEAKLRAQLAKSPEANAARLDGGKKELAAHAQQKESLEQSLKEEQDKADPVFKEIDRLNGEIERCQTECERKKALLAEHAEIPRKLAELRKRLENAQLLKVGFLKKFEFSEELLAEIPGADSEKKKEELARYKALCDKLQSMIFEP